MNLLIIPGLIKLWKGLNKKLRQEITILEKTLLKFDDCNNDQRKVIFSQRRENLVKFIRKHSDNTLF